MEPFRFERFARSRMCSPNDDISKKENKNWTRESNKAVGKQ